MSQRKFGSFVDVDAFQRDSSLQEAAAKCGVELPLTSSGRNERIDCPFRCEGDHVGKREIAVDTENPAKQWRCHAYGCEMRGNLLCLLYGWLNGKRWTGDKLRGAEFSQVRDIISGTRAEATQLIGGGTVGVAPNETATAQPPRAEVPKAIPANPPLRTTETGRGLMEPPIWEKLITDISKMSPEASAYVRRRPFLSEAMEKWHVGVMPTGGEDKRGWSLRNHVVYPFLSEAGEVIAFVGRDPQYEEKLRAFEATEPDKRDAEKRPMKHRFPKGFHRGIELFGQQYARLKEPGYRDAIQKYGIIVVEGFNDVLRLDGDGIPSVGICSNIITEGQVDRLARWSRLLKAPVTLMFDCDAEGERGAADAAWKLLQAGISVQALWSLGMFAGKFRGKQPEDVTRRDLHECLARLPRRESSVAAWPRQQRTTNVAP